MSENKQQDKTPPKMPMRGPGGRGGRGAVGPGEKPLNFKATIKATGKHLRPERWLAIVAVIFTIAGVILSLLGPYLMGLGTDVIYEALIRDFNPGVDWGAMRTILFIAAGVYTLSFIFGWSQGRIIAGVVQRTAARIRSEVAEKINNLPLRYLDRAARGDLLSRVTNDVDNMQQTLQQSLSQMVHSVTTLLGVVAMMLFISPSLALVAILTVPVAVFITTKIAKKAQPQFIKQWAATGRLNAQVEEMFTGHEVVTAFGRKEKGLADFEEENNQLFQSSRKAQFISGTIQPVMGLLGNLGFIAVAVIGGWQVLNGVTTLGGVQAFVQYTRRFTMPLTEVASMMNLLQSGAASAERVFELLDADEEQAVLAALSKLPAVRGEVEFRDVTFSYDPERPLITDLNLKVAPGQTVAIVGPTGAGKTTLVNLLMRFYDLDGGAILLDGVDIAAVPRRELRTNLGMVLQDTWLFDGTIEENLRYGVAEGVEVSEEEFLAATRATHVDSFVRTLPAGYQTRLTADNTVISTGEKQLLTIARAFLSDPAILVLDEATSSVDTRTEILVQQAMNALRSGRTSFVIAHRLSTIRDADIILVMEHGAIVEQGNHDELLAAGGAYARLYQSQFEN